MRRFQQGCGPLYLPCRHCALTSALCEQERSYGSRQAVQPKRNGVYPYPCPYHSRHFAPVLCVPLPAALDTFCRRPVDGV